MKQEYFDIYDEAGNRIGRALRSECHGNPALLHHTSHVVVFHPARRPDSAAEAFAVEGYPAGKWDTAVGGHVDAGEDYLAAALRELREELGVTASAGELRHLFDSKITMRSNPKMSGYTPCGPPGRSVSSRKRSTRFASGRRTNWPGRKTGRASPRT